MQNSPNKHATPRADAIWNLFGSLMYAGCQWLVLVATVKLSSPAEVGRLSLGFAVTAPIFLLLQLRLRAASATDAALAFTRSDYVVLRVICTMIALLITTVLCTVTGMSHDEAVIVMLIALAKAIESGSDLMYGLSQRAEDLRAVALSLAARGLLSVVAFVALLTRTHQLAPALAGLCASWGVVFLLVDLPIATRHTDGADKKLAQAAKWSYTSVAQLAWLTLPLGLSTMFMSLSANMPRYFIRHSLGDSALGIFSAAGYLTMTGSVTISAIAESSIARMAKLLALEQIAAAKAILNRVRDLTIVLSGALIAVSLLFGKQILGLVYRKEYGNAHALLALMMIAAAAANLASVYGYALIAARKFQSYLWCLILSAACTAIACAIAIPRWGTLGAAFGCLVGYAFQVAASRTLLRSALAGEKADTIAPLAASAAFKL